MQTRRRNHRAPRPALSEIGRLDSTCPYCEEELAKRPERKTACPHCGRFIFVRSRPYDRKRVLLTDLEANQIETEWSALQMWVKRGRHKH
jgi:DNA-directed RNA polymerase subunit RPC12/RpoP